MQSFEDTRQSDVVHDVRTLESNERAEYNKMQKYMHISRTCCICGSQFRLRNTVGMIQPNHHGRDHIDYETESFEHWFELCMDRNVFNVLHSTGYIPITPAGVFSESADTQCIRRVDRPPPTRVTVSA
jgi:hypothetical protein